MFAKQFVSFLVWVLFASQFFGWWLCLSLGLSVSWELCLSVGLSVSWELCLSVGLSVSWELCLLLGLCVCGLVKYVIMPFNSREGASVGLFN